MPKDKYPTPAPDPRKVYQLALRYSEASQILKCQMKGDNWGVSAPRLLVDSFAIELYLKCLYVLDTGLEPLKQHDWVKLFDSLGAQTRIIIREEFDRIVNRDPILRNLEVINPEAKMVTDFDRSLRAAANTFEKRRYIFETPPVGEWFYAHLLHEAIRGVTSLDLRLSGLQSEEETSDGE